MAIAFKVPTTNGRVPLAVAGHRHKITDEEGENKKSDLSSDPLPQSLPVELLLLPNTVFILFFTKSIYD